MKARLPKSWDRLPPREKEIINQVMTDEVVKQVCHEQAELQKIWLQMACIVLHRCFGFDRDQCLMFLGNWYEMYYVNSKLEGKAEQEKYLADEMEKIFGKDGFPKEFIDGLEDI